MAENYLDKLRQTAKENRTIACVGLDPDFKKIPASDFDTAEDIITSFYANILQKMASEGIKPAAVKPNYAYFAQYGFSGLRALKNVIEVCKAEGIGPIILDFKRGDIGNTSKAYAKEGFEVWDADAVTVAPFMGSDSVGPFIEWCDNGKGVYILNRTSNKGREDLQDLRVIPSDMKIGDIIEKRLREFFKESRAIPDEKIYSSWIMAADETNIVRVGMRESFKDAVNSSSMPLYMAIAEKILEWHKPGTGAVAGATSPDELEKLSEFYVKSGKIVPMLIPGVGKQGGSASEVIARLIKTGNDLLIHRINSSSEINYAWQKEDTADYAGAAVRALDKLNKEIRASGLENYL